MAGSIFRIKDLSAYTKLSRSTIYDRLNEKSKRYDPTFPKSFLLTSGTVGWFKEDIDKWLEKCASHTPNIQPSTASALGAVQDVVPVVKSTQAKSKQVSSGGNRLATTSLVTLPISASSSNHQPNLGGLILQGAQQNVSIANYLNMTTWTPVMAALLVSGINASLDCHEVPIGGVGLDNQALHGSNRRFHQARSILKKWNDQESAPPLEINPIDFLRWCDDEDVDTDWIRLFRDMIGCSVPDTKDLTASRFALLVVPTVQPVGKSKSK
ncbi:prophage CP4-57 regulatory protein (AlpA) [mine drainage metagenome]|uniref:Prophage CP4-57 regulatory protein (AlpA) n=1 Tax=mine drainage metagenome TaxID=410659 RepID=A0A1J5T8E9_9ZZZZ